MSHSEDRFLLLLDVRHEEGMFDVPVANSSQHPYWNASMGSTSSKPTILSVESVSISLPTLTGLNQQPEPEQPERIPPPTPEPSLQDLFNDDGNKLLTIIGQFETIHLGNNDFTSAANKVSGASFVYFDLETAGLAVSTEICQIAAKYRDMSFNVYMAPSAIEPGASKVNSMTVHEGQLLYRGEAVETVSERTALLNFLQFLKQIGRRVVLVAHNAFNFDAKIIMYRYRRSEFFKEFVEVVVGFCDTLTLLREKVPNRPSYKLVNLVKSILELDENDLHNAVVDVRVLEELIVKLQVEEEEMFKHTRALAQF